MMKADGRRYLFYFVALTALFLSLPILGNIAFDPYGMVGVRVAGLSDIKPSAWSYSRLGKPLRMIGRHYDVLLVGSSRVERGMSPTDPMFSEHGVTAYNSGWNGMSPDEVAGLIRFAHTWSGVSTTIINLDFLFYNNGGNGQFLPPDWSVKTLMSRYLALAYSFGGLKDIWETVVASWTMRPSVLDYLSQGQLNVDFLPENFRGTTHYRGIFDSYDRAVLNSNFAWLASQATRIQQHGFEHSALISIIEAATANGVKLIFYFPPEHVRAREVMAFLGLLPLEEQWKREVTKVVAERAPQFPLWDFGDYSNITTEPVPPAPDNVSVMRWYWDPMHFKTPVGRAIMSKVLGFTSVQLDPAFAGFGTLLTTANLDAHLADVRARHKIFTAEHPEVVAIIASLYQGTIPRLAAPGSSKAISVVEATYGGNCGAPRGNATGPVSVTCDGQSTCEYVVDFHALGDPANGCGKGFEVQYRCSDSASVREAKLPGEAGFRSRAALNCLVSPLPIKVLEATYGGNCGVAQGNVTAALASSCDGLGSCDYIVDFKILGDPANGCGKDFAATYRCGDETVTKSIHLPGEAGFRSHAQLSCPAPDHSTLQSSR